MSSSTGGLLGGLVGGMKHGLELGECALRLPPRGKPLVRKPWGLTMATGVRGKGGMVMEVLGEGRGDGGGWGCGVPLWRR